MEKMELTDEYIVGDMMHSARVFIIIGILILVMMLVAVITARAKGTPFSRVVVLLVCGVFLSGGMIFIGVRTMNNVQDYTVIETVVKDKKCVEGMDTLKEKREDSKNDRYYVYFENDFVPDTSVGGYSEANIGDHVYIVHMKKTGVTQYYYGDTYVYTGSHGAVADGK